MAQQSQQQAAMLSKQGIELIQAGRDAEAVDVLRRAATIRPTSFSIQYNLGVAYSNTGKWREAWQAYAQCTRIAPNDFHSWTALAEAYEKCGDKQKALEVLSSTRKRLGRDPRVLQAIDQQIMALGGQAQGPVSASNVLRAASNLQQDGKHSEAVALLRPIVKSSPNDSNALTMFSYSLCKTGNFKEALQPAKDAARLVPNNPEYLTNVMYIQTQVGDLDGLQDSRKQFAARFPKDPRAASIGDEIKYYQDDFAKIKQRETSGQATSSDMADSLVFSRKDMPLKVYVHNRFKGRTTWSATSQKATGINYSLLVEQAFNEWSGASGRAITFQFIDNPDHANIECAWTDDRSKLVHSFAAGVTQFRSNKDGKRLALIYLLTMPESENFNSSIFYGCSMHEIGHALGLSHSSNPNDIMYFSETFQQSKNLPSLSAADTSRIRSLYNGSR